MTWKLIDSLNTQEVMVVISPYRVYRLFHFQGVPRRGIDEMEIETRYLPINEDHARLEIPNTGLNVLVP